MQVFYLEEPYCLDDKFISDIPTKVGVIFLQSKSDIETFGFSDIIFVPKTRHWRISLPEGQYNLRSKYHLFRKEQI